MLETEVKHTFIVGVYWIAFTILAFGFVFCGKEKRFRFDIYDFVLMILCVLSVGLFALVLI